MRYFWYNNNDNNNIIIIIVFNIYHYVIHNSEREINKPID